VLLQAGAVDEFHGEVGAAVLLSDGVDLKRYWGAAAGPPPRLVWKRARSPGPARARRDHLQGHRAGRVRSAGPGRNDPIPPVRPPRAAHSRPPGRSARVLGARDPTATSHPQRRLAPRCQPVGHAIDVLEGPESASDLSSSTSRVPAAEFLGGDVLPRFQTEGRGGGPAAAPQYRSDLHRRRAGRPPLLRHGNSSTAPAWSSTSGADLSRRRRQPGWWRRLARAVHHAHRRGIVHRDLKPANILLTAEGTPKDRRLWPGQAADGPGRGPSPGRRTRTGAILGALSYMAPEQADGQIRAIGSVADVSAPEGTKLLTAPAEAPPPGARPGPAPSWVPSATWPGAGRRADPGDRLCHRRLRPGGYSV